MTISLAAPAAILGRPEPEAGNAGEIGRAGTAASLASTPNAALWPAVLADLERDSSISRASFATWLLGTQLLDVQGDEFTVGAQHAFALDKLERSFRGAIERALQRQTGNADARVRLVVNRAPTVVRPSNNVPRPLPLKSDPRDGNLALNQPKRTASGDEHQSSVLSSALQPHWTFETFAVGRQNQFAYAAAYAVADNPSFAYNPLVLFGPPGVGKTHLLHAIGRRVVALRAGARVAYLPARALVAEWLRCGADAAAFAAYRERFSHADVLLLDDLQLLPALGPVGVGLQAEVARLVAAQLHDDGQVAVASQISPRMLGGLEDALRNRLQAGLIAELGAREPPAPAPAAVSRPASPASLATPVTPSAPSRRRIGPDDVLGAVAAYYGVPVQELQAKRRDKGAVVPRQVAMFLLREETGISLSEIGDRLGGRDHTTVLHGCEKVAAQLAGDASLRADVEAIRQRLAVVSHGAVPGTAAAAAAAP
jgi:chromosomal replication initiator protein